MVDNDKVEVVREFLKSYLELKSIRKVQHYLFELGYKTHHGKYVSVWVIRNILTNRFYLGEVKHSDLIVKGQHEPLVN
ncbi:recombinase family protein [Bacillus sp. NPDC093026]|uniref:recombinase family protein n=1 Tax=Bacillus sp. NPDC093026 TaxID=3363948 RepID=UPI003801F3DA